MLDTSSTPQNSSMRRGSSWSTLRGSGGRYIPVAWKLSLAVVGVLAVATAWASVTLSDNARAALIESKRAGASMVLDLFSASVGAALDFGDDEGLQEELDALAANQDIVYAAVWRDGEAKPRVELDRRKDKTAPPTPKGPPTTIGSKAIDFVEPIAAPSGEKLGSAVVRFSLAPEIARYEDTRTRILMFSGLLAVAVSLVLLAIARWQIVGPLQRLSRAARKLEAGQAVTVETTAHDELGRLGLLFNRMTDAIVDREQRLRSLNGRLQQLLDHMRQAIVVFGSGGDVEEVRSRQAEAIFGLDKGESRNLVSLLYPDREGSVEAESVTAWIDALSAARAEDWDELASLAPTEVVLHAGQPTERLLSLEFRPLDLEGSVDRIMLLATDETEKRKLEQTVERKELEHKQQMTALRRFVAGGELILSLLRRSADRVLRCREILEAERPELALGDVNAMFQEMHSIKGEARAFDFVLLEAAAAAAEDVLSICRRRLREQEDVKRYELRASLGVRLDQVLSQIRDAETMLVEASPVGAEVLERVTVHRADLTELLGLAKDRNDAIGRATRRLAARPFGESVVGVVDSAPLWANALGKRIQIDVQGRDVRVPAELADVVPAILAHLVRNAIVHGIENPEKRLRAGKAESGFIRIECTDDARFRISVRDDGAGIDRDAVLRSAKEAGIDAKAAEELIFTPGITTRASVDDLAGRGVGLSAVRSDLAAVGYTVRIQSVPGDGTTATIERLEEGPA